MKDKLTDQNYWENYYHQASTQKANIENVCGYYNAIWDIWVKSAARKPETVIEIGAYPGRYIAYFAAKLGLHVTGLDYNSDLNKIKESMEVMGVKDYDYIQADFFKYLPDKKYDLVFSGGFIEHFDDFKTTLDLHLNYLASTGSLLVMIPNMNYLRKYYARLLDKKNIEVHNLNSMHLSVFKDFASRNNLQIKYLSYEGGFSFNVHEPLTKPYKKLAFKVTRKIFKAINPLLAKYPSKYYSANIIGIFTRKQDI